jgi:hypothetical protein
MTFPRLVPQPEKRRPSIAIIARGTKRKVEAERVVERGLPGKTSWNEPESKLQEFRRLLAETRLWKWVKKS